MKLEDTAPAEFLFGRLAENVTFGPSGNSSLDYNRVLLSDRKLNFILLFTNLIYGFMLYVTLSLAFTNRIFGAFILFFTISGLLSALKNYAFLSKYGQDLKVNNSTSGFGFALVQVYLNYLVATMLFMFSYFVLFNYDGLNSILSQSVLAFISLFIYIRVIPDIGLTSLCQGSSILNPPGGCRNLLKHYFNLSKIQGREVVKLSFLRLSFLIISAIIFYFYWVLWLIILASLLFSYFVLEYEKINASSAIMENRAEIMTTKPSILPSKVIKEEVEFSFTNSNSNPKGFTAKKKISFQKSQKSGKLFGSPINNLKPFAVKTITKIAESIKNEESIPTHINCYRCRKVVEYPSDFCYYCGYDLK